MLGFCLDPNILQEPLKCCFEEAKLKIEEKLVQMRDLLESQRWNVEFREVLERFPYLKLSNLPRERKGSVCDVCHLSRSFTSKHLKFDGQCYDNETFECVEDDQKQRKMGFDAGIICASRSKLYHRVFHYKYKLFEKCQQAIDSFDSINYDKQSVLDTCMDNENWVSKLYDDFNEMYNAVLKMTTVDGKS